MAVDRDDALDLILGTINAPRPRAMDAKTLLRCLRAQVPDPKWQAHVEAFFDECSDGAVHDLTLTGLVTFEELYRAARTWRASEGKLCPWIQEMADLKAGITTRHIRWTTRRSDR
jgi:hypothetical protein